MRVCNCRDLKRDVAKKLEKLERRTQRAIAELIRQYSSLVSTRPTAVKFSLPFKHTEVSDISSVRVESI